MDIQVLPRGDGNVEHSVLVLQSSVSRPAVHAKKKVRRARIGKWSHSVECWYIHSDHDIHRLMYRKSGDFVVPSLDYVPIT